MVYCDTEESTRTRKMNDELSASWLLAPDQYKPDSGVHKETCRTIWKLTHLHSS